MTTLSPIPDVPPEPAPLEPVRWVREHGDVLWRFAIALVGSTAVAEDLVQDALAAALRGVAGFQGRSSERTWLLGILRNKAAEHLRRERRRGAATRGGVIARMYDERGMWKDEPCAARGPDPLERTDLADALWVCVRALPPLLREAFDLHEVRGLPASETCRELGITTRNLWVRMHRARLLLRECLRGHAIDGGAS